MPPKRKESKKQTTQPVKKQKQQQKENKVDKKQAKNKTKERQVELQEEILDKQIETRSKSKKTKSSIKLTKIEVEGLIFEKNKYAIVKLSQQSEESDNSLKTKKDSIKEKGKNKQKKQQENNSEEKKQTKPQDKGVKRSRSYNSELQIFDPLEYSVCKILQIEEIDGEVMLQVQWYVTPNEVNYVKPFIGRAELFLTYRTSFIEKEALDCPCTVLDIEEYESFNHFQNDEVVFYCRAM